MIKRITRRRMAATSSWAVLSLALTCGAAPAFAQAGPSEAPAAAPQDEPQDASQEEGEAIIVVGSRASQQSSNARKKNAKTATDSIVADDIGSFPDRNINEAISRVPGVALNRNEFGEGEGVALRGNGPELTRVELDGVGVQSTNGIALGLGRGADMRELPAELVKSVDIVKGSTADQTEGGLGGSIKITTRSGLDFKKPYVSIRAGAQQNSLGEKWRPDFNGVAGGRFLNDRLGVIVSGTYTRLQNNGHNYETTTSNNRNYSRLFDFDGSPEKTFSYNPATVGTDAANVAFANSMAPDGTTLTPRELVGLAAGATSKAQCLTIFPDIPNGFATNPPGTTLATVNAQRTQRMLEQQSCLNQWNDYTPSLIRHLMNTQDEERYSIDARFDYRLTDRLTVYAKGMISNRYVDDRFRTRTPVTMFNQNIQGTFVDTPSGNQQNRTVAPSAPAGYFLFDPVYGLNNVLVGTGNTARNTPTFGNVLNIVPSSVVVDSEHNVTKMTLTNNSVSIDEINNIIDSKSRYGQAGIDWRPTDRLFIEAFAGLSQTDTKRGDMRTSRAYAYGDATLTLQPNGLWDIDLPSNYNEADPANFVQLAVPRCVNAAQSPPNCIAQNAVVAGEFVPASAATVAYTAGQLPAVTPSFGVSYSPQAGETEERIAKLDATWDTKDVLPFITRIKAGGQYRRNQLDRWGAGGYTVASQQGTYGNFNPPTPYVPGIYVPTANVRGTVRACQPTATSTVSCNYGYVPSADPRAVRSGVDTLTPDQLRALFAATAYDQESNYFNGLPNRGDLPPAWQGIRTADLFAALGAGDFMNFDCLKVCKGSDGKMYAQPVQHTDETIKNIYGMVDFETKLPFGLLFNGNVGLRGVFANVKGSGLLTLTNITKTSAYQPANPNATGGTLSQSFSMNTTVDKKTTNWLPSVNLNLWAFNETVVLRAYGGKTMSRPSPSLLLPAGTCTTDERIADGDVDADFGCSVRVGNPGLAPFQAWNYNLALEWYPNADTVLSVAYGKLDVKVGNPIQVTVLTKPFAGSSVTDPVTGQPLADIEFSVPTYANGPGYKRDIWEFNFKTAFTFLPWFLQHMGFDGNLSILQSVATTGQQDPLTGDVMLPPDESKYYANASLWYDDGKLNVRTTYQKRSSRFTCITPCGGNTTDINYPGEQWTNVRLVAPGWNPGVARFADGSAFIDAKISYNITRNFQVYLEGRNVMREAQTISTGPYIPFADGTPRVMRLSYGGRRILGGVKVQFGN